MKHFLQFLIILAFSMLGELLQALIPLPVPASIYGLVLLFAALCSGLLKAEKVEKAAEFLISVMPILFVAPAADILLYFDVIAPSLAAIITTVVLSTFLVFAVSGFVAKALLGGRKKG